MHMADNLILVRLTEKFADRIFHEFDNAHPHKTAQGGELLVTGGVIERDKDGKIEKDPRRVAPAARTQGVLHAIMQNVLEEVRDPSVQPTPDPVDILDVVNGNVQPGYPAPASEATASEAASSDPAADASASKASKASSK